MSVYMMKTEEEMTKHQMLFFAHRDHVCIQISESGQAHADIISRQILNVS